MVNWLIVGILVLAGIIAIRLNHLRHKVFIVLLITIALFFYLSVTTLNKENEFDYKSTQGIIDASKVYFGWMANGFHNSKTIVGNAFKLDWTSTNGTFREDGG